MNIPYNDQSAPGFNRLKQFERKYGLDQKVLALTRCTLTKQSVLDLILTNSPHITHTCSPELNISDHQPTIMVRKKILYKQPLTSFTCRSFNNYDKISYQHDLCNHDWTNYFVEDYVNLLWSELERTIRNTADAHCPEKTINRRKSIPKWLNPDLLELMFERDRIYRIAKRSQSADDWIAARRLRNSCIEGVRRAKCQYTKILADY